VGGKGGDGVEDTVEGDDSCEAGVIPGRWAMGITEAGGTALTGVVDARVAEVAMQEELGRPVVRGSPAAARPAR
jgi:hypothetical protein